MFLKPVEFSGMVQNAPEISHIKSEQDSQNQTQQNLMMNAAEVEHEREQTQVRADIKTETENLQDDTESGGTYYRREDAKKKKKKKFDDGVLIDKNKKKSFDVKI